MTTEAGTGDDLYPPGCRQPWPFCQLLWLKLAGSGTRFRLTHVAETVDLDERSTTRVGDSRPPDREGRHGSTVAIARPYGH